MDEAFEPGAVMEWRDAHGLPRRGIVSRVVAGRVYLRCRQVNRRGRRVEREVEVWFDPNEVDRLRRVQHHH